MSVKGKGKADDVTLVTNDNTVTAGQVTPGTTMTVDKDTSIKILSPGFVLWRSEEV
jgi:hypothetical protein